MKKHISNISLKVGTNSAGVLRELANTIRSMRKSSKVVDILIAEMNSAAQELQDLLKSYPNLVTTPPSHTTQGSETETTSSGELPHKKELTLMDVIQVVTIASLLIETVARVEDIVCSVKELSDLAEFKEEKCKKSKQNIEDNREQKDEKDMKTLQMV